MAPPADIPALRSSAVSAVSVSDAPTPASAASNLGQGANSQATLGNLTQNAVGQAFQAQVLAQLEDGSFVVQVAENALRMALPAGSTVGNTLDMTLLATEPRPAFLLEQQTTDASSASLSSAAKLINTVLQTAQQTGTPATLVGKTPLVASPDTNTPELATALQDSIEFSGVFYEAHVSQWANGDRPLADLLMEPQAQEGAATDAAGNAGAVLPRPPLTGAELSRMADAAYETSVHTPPNAAQNAPTGNATGTPANGPGSPAATPRTLLAQALNALSNAGNAQPKEADVVVRSPTLTQSNAQTINVQLNALEQHRIAWTGEVWPGQRMEWEIVEEKGGNGKGANPGEDQTTWQSVVRFDLPHLGKVSASVHLSGGRVRVQVNAASADTATTLLTHGDDLANALEAAGSPLDAFIVKQDT